MLRAGYTGGPLPVGLIDISTHAGHVVALLDAVDIGPATVVAHSFGCVIALQLAVDRSDLVSWLWTESPLSAGGSPRPPRVLPAPSSMLSSSSPTRSPPWAAGRRWTCR